MARSFLIGSYIDLAKLMPRFSDVVCAYGKDYIVLAFSPASFDQDQRVDAFVSEDAGHTNLPPDQTYFVVFRYGAVVLFQGFDNASEYSQYMRQSTRQLQVSAPARAVQQLGGFENPWETSAETWRHAAQKDHDGELIYLLLRPFISESSDGILFEADILPSSQGTGELLDDRVFSRPLQRSSSDRASPLLYKESVHMIINPDQEPHMVQKPDVFFVKQLDVGTLRCVASALGQSSALDFYSQKVDAALKEAEKATKEMAQTGMFKQRHVNFQSMIGYCSLIHSAVISQIGLLDKNDLAWQYAKYDKMLELLRAEFDLEKRLKNLEAKIAVVAGTASIFLGIQQHAKSNFLEWLIVVLIAAEILVSLYDMFWHSRQEKAEAAPASTDAVVPSTA